MATHMYKCAVCWSPSSHSLIPNSSSSRCLNVATYVHAFVGALLRVVHVNSPRHSVGPLCQLLPVTILLLAALLILVLSIIHSAAGSVAAPGCAEGPGAPHDAFDSGIVAPSDAVRPRPVVRAEVCSALPFGAAAGGKVPQSCVISNPSIIVAFPAILSVHAYWRLLGYRPRLFLTESLPY